MDPVISSCRSSLAPIVVLASLAGAGCAPSDSDRSRPDGALATAPALASAARAVTERSDHKSSFTVFESGQVRPLAISADGRHLFAVNTPDNRLEIFRVAGGRLIAAGSIAVGLEPVAVAIRDDHELWVVNHLSDSVSVIKLHGDGEGGRVERTLLVGDEPRDIVFAGPGRRRAFITTAHRGQNIPFDPQLTTPGVGRADVWVFDAAALGDSLGGTPLSIVTLFTDTPRALAVTPDGSRVYAAGFHSGNQTTSVMETQIPDGFGPDGVAGPPTNFQGAPAPEVGAIVKWNGSHWVDSLGRARDASVKLSLPDKDVFAIDAMATPPRPVTGPGGVYTKVGTILYTMAVNPVSGKVYVANTDANNADRFEGPGTFAGHSLRGHLHESRITVLSLDGSVASRHLNKHIDYAHCCAPIPNPENARSLALPQGMAVTRDGATLYVAALGSDKIGVFSTRELEADTFTPSVASQIPVTGGGPTGVVLDDDHHLLFALTRFDDAISVIDTRSRMEVGHVAMHNPEPASVTRGRRFLYSAARTSSHGDSACASCHVFGDFDSLAWDLGNPDAPVIRAPGPFRSVLVNLLTGAPVPAEFHPMKGPMTTQSLRGMANHGPMHWRGDRTGGNDAPTAQPDGGTFDERAAFHKFTAGFTDLLGRDVPIADADMDAYTDFILQVVYPPNPIRALDNSLTPDQDAGRRLFETVNCGIPTCLDGTCPPQSCTGCHTLDPRGNAGVSAPGFFGTSGASSFDFNLLAKVPHLRNMYQKIGMFGSAPHPAILGGDNGNKGDQVRGFGFMHDGEMDTLFRFHHAVPFSVQFTGPGNGGIPDGDEGERQRRQLEAYILAFPSNLAPIVGQQITLASTAAGSSAPALARANLLRQRADAGECDLIAKAELGGREAGFLYLGNGLFRPDRRGQLTIRLDALERLATHGDAPITFSCVPLGSGERDAVDRDGDGFWDGDEADAQSDPLDAASIPHT